MLQYNNKKVAILGLSVEGIDSAAFFFKQHAQITCCDKRTKEELGSSYEKLQGYASDFQLGPEYLSRLDRFDLVVRSPGMAIRTAELNMKGLTVTSLTKLFFQHCKAPIIGVTGTKGKGTTSSLIYDILVKEGKHAWLGGNVGTPLLSQVENISPSDIVILELSSFQLEDLTASPHIAVVLKVTQEHLANIDPLATNYHESRDAYVEAKKSIVRYQSAGDIAVMNADDPTSSGFSALTKARAYYFSRSKETADSYVKDGEVFLKWNGTVSSICRESDIQLIGMHNLENIACSALVGILSGASIESIQSAVRAFKGLEHRLELVRTLDGIAYYDDSFSTVPETAIAAIQSFKQPLILIVGGSEKRSDYTELGKEITQSNIRALIVIGDMTERIVAAARQAGYTGDLLCGLKTMRDIVKTSQKQAKTGDVVLLSPACASFDMYKNYKERGNIFKHEVSIL